MNERAKIQKEPRFLCPECGRCPNDPVLAAAKRIVCLEYMHPSVDELEADANIVANALLAEGKE